MRSRSLYWACLPLSWFATGAYFSGWGVSVHASSALDIILWRGGEACEYIELRKTARNMLLFQNSYNLFDHHTLARFLTLHPPKPHDSTFLIQVTCSLSLKFYFIVSNCTLRGQIQGLISCLPLHHEEPNPGQFKTSSSCCPLDDPTTHAMVQPYSRLNTGHLLLPKVTTSIWKQTHHFS